jgi:hypothetical protein
VGRATGVGAVGRCAGEDLGGHRAGKKKKKKKKKKKCVEVVL